MWSWYRAPPTPPKPFRCAADVYFKIERKQREASQAKEASRVHVAVPPSAQPLSSLQPPRVLVDAVG